jgi:hypothetical protein
MEIFVRIQDLDRDRRVVPSADLRDLLVRQGSDRIANDTWSTYRKSAGITGKRRMLSQYESALLISRRYWRKLCSDTGSTYLSNPEIFTLENVSNAWLEGLPQELIDAAMRELSNLGEAAQCAISVLLLYYSLSGASTIESWAVEVLIKSALGESHPRHRLYRRAGFSTRETYRAIDVLRMMNAIQH